MKILVLGAGVIGVTTAYYLAKSGYDVTVVDRQAAAGCETSFANAGEISPGYASPWAGPGMPLKALRWMLDRHGPLVIRPKPDPAMWRWIARTLRNCTSERYLINKSRMVPIAEYSRDCLRTLRADTGISYDERSFGTLQLFRESSQLDAIGKDVRILREYGVPYQICDVAACIAAEPALNRAAVAFAGGLRLPDDETGDCHLFTQRLMEIAGSLGVRFVGNCRIEGMIAERGRITSVVSDLGTLTADAYVMALGSFSAGMLRPLGIEIPVYPVKGYSITVPILDEARAPMSTVMDESHKVAITRLGNRIRVGGTAEIGGYSITLPPGRRATLERSLRDLFPDAGSLSDTTFWSGLRPMTPDGPPIIGATGISNLWLNTGHGTLGWTMACGSGRVVADLIAGRDPDLDISKLSLSRYDTTPGHAFAYSPGH